ncbi:MAG: hypothetical protein NT096_01420 [Proteobacteria bacterium]|nr:hypothetical protein [Pseudomonadota bacterium]
MSSKDITATEQDNDTLSFVASIDSVTVPEGSTATFQVKLSAQPSSTVTALVSYTSGDSDITVQSGSSLSFTTSNWNTYQTVTLAAAEDSDTANGTATIQVSATGISSKSITATEQDNDTEVCTGSTINVGIVSACASGNQVEVPVTINDIAGETGCNFSVSFDKTKLQYTGKTSGTMGGTLLVASVSDINAAGVVQPIVTFDDGGPTSGTICKFEFTLLSPIAEGSQIDLTIGNINAPTVTFCGKNGAVACGGENTTWADVIVEYNNYVSGNVTWDEVIAAYQAYVSQ